MIADEVRPFLPYLGQTRYGKALYAALWTISGAAIVSAIAFVKDDVAVRVASLVTQGDIGGDWDIETWSYSEGNKDENNEPIRISQKATLQQLGYRIIGTINSRTQPRHWKAEGYYNPPHFGLVYVTSVRGGVALGTHTLQRVPDGTFAFLGFWTGVDCKGLRPERHQVLLQCPVVFMREDRLDLLKPKYDYHLNIKCEEVNQEALAERRSSTALICAQQAPFGTPR